MDLSFQITHFSSPSIVSKKGLINESNKKVYYFKENGLKMGKMLYKDKQK